MLAVLSLAACDPGSATGASGGEAAPAADQKATAPDSNTQTEGKTDAKPEAKPETKGPLGSISKTDAVDFTALVHKTPEQVEAVLGAHEESGSDRVSCVRFVPERVFFACEQEIRTYNHPAFEKIRIEYEDGRSARVGIIGLPGSGELEPTSALALVGLSVPGEPRSWTEAMSTRDGTPDGTAHIWEWGNSSAKLLVDGQQQRVRLSIVDDNWARSKVELINNNPLTDAQKARIKLPRGESAPSSSPEASESDSAAPAE